MSLFGGFIIAIASYIYLQVGGILGALLFSIGLLTILNMKFKLFTGTIGYARTIEDIGNNLIILIGNIIGACGSALLRCDSASPLVEAKLAIPLYLVLFKGIICGIFIYCAVSCFKNHKEYMVPVCVVGFILSGGEHCIADLCYIISAGFLSLDSIIFLIVVTIGNIIGAQLIDRVTEI